MKFKEDEAFENYQKDPTEREIFNSQLLKINEFDQDFKHKTEQLLLIENRIQKEILTLSKIQNPSILSVFPPNFLKTNQISNIQEEFYKSFCNPYIDNNINLDQNVNNIKLDSDNNYNYPFENSQEGNNNILFQSQIHNEIAIHNNNNNNNNNNENQLFNNNYNNEQLIYPANYSPFTNNNNNNNNNNNEIAIHNNENQLFNNNQLPNNNQIQKSDFVSFTNLDNLMSILDKKNEEIQNNLNATLQEKELVIQNEINSFSSMVENESKKIKIGGIFIGSFLALSFIIYISINESKKKKKPISKST